jgi:hypothetical protein
MCFLWHSGIFCKESILVRVELGGFEVEVVGGEAVGRGTSARLLSKKMRQMDENQYFHRSNSVRRACSSSELIIGVGSWLVVFSPTTMG